MKSSLIINMISILMLSGFVLEAGTMEQLSHCSCALKQITEVFLRAAASYHANEGVSVK